MTLELLNDAARATHLLGLALGFGVAILADLSAARSLFRPLDGRELSDLERYHSTISFGLMLFWTSGLVLLWVRTGFDVANFTPKLVAKLIVVSLLSVNAFLIGRVGLPIMFAYAGYPFGALPWRHRLRLGALAGMSVAGWIAALALGVFSAMKSFDWDLLSGIIGAIYVLGLGGALLTALFAPMISFAIFRRWRA